MATLRTEEQKFLDSMNKQPGGLTYVDRLKTGGCGGKPGDSLMDPPPAMGAIAAASGSLPEDSAARKNLPIATVMQRYFPKAFAYVALVSKRGNDQHNPGEPMHWARGKSDDHEECMARHMIDLGKKDAKGVRHSGNMAWRALANLQLELERAEAAGEKWWEDGSATHT